MTKIIIKYNDENHSDLILMEAKFAFSSVTRLSGTSILSVSLIIKSFHGFLFSFEHAKNLEWNYLDLNVTAQFFIELSIL